jgi:hypothetical protein
MPVAQTNNEDDFEEKARRGFHGGPSMGTEGNIQGGKRQQKTEDTNKRVDTSGRVVEGSLEDLAKRVGKDRH